MLQIFSLKSGWSYPTFLMIFSGAASQIHLGLGGKPRGDENDGAGYSAFRSDSGIWILVEKLIHDRIADLVAKLVRVSLGYRLGCEYEIFRHGYQSFFFFFVMSLIRSGSTEDPPMTKVSNALSLGTPRKFLRGGKNMVNACNAREMPRDQVK